MSDFKLTKEQREWCKKKRRQGLSCKEQEGILKEQKGLCALSGCKMIFNPVLGKPIQGGTGCHPLYPAVDHKDPGNSKGDFQIVCYALNDVKGHLSNEMFRISL